MFRCCQSIPDILLRLTAPDLSLIHILEPPAVLELFESLCRKGILKSSLPLPKNLNALEKYISDVKINTHYGGTKTVSKETKKAILAVSFGTSHNDTRKITIDAIEQDMQAAFPDYALYRAWTSKMIIKKVNARDGVHTVSYTHLLPVRLPLSFCQ